MLNLIDNINSIKGQNSLLEKTPGIKDSLKFRDPYTDPLHFLQIELMCRSRNSESQNEDINKALLITIAGIAASMRNTG